MRSTPLGCPACGCKGPHRVTHTHHHEASLRGRPISFTRRRRVCRHCGLPYWTREVDEEALDEILDSPPPPPQTGPPELPPDLLG